MNGLEAIKAMEHGKIVHDSSIGIAPCLYKIVSGKVMTKPYDGSKHEWEDCLEFLLNDVYEVYNPNQNTGWHSECGKKNIYCLIGYNGQISSISPLGVPQEADEDRFSHALKAQEIEFKQRTFRKLQRFSDENGGNEIDWSNSKSCKCCICYDHEEEELVVGDVRFIRDFGQVYFKTEELAEQAIELFKEDLIKYFTHKWMECE